MEQQHLLHLAHPAVAVPLVLVPPALAEARLAQVRAGHQVLLPAVARQALQVVGLVLHLAVDPQALVGLLPQVLVGLVRLVLVVEAAVVLAVRLVQEILDATTNPALGWT